MNYWYIPFVTTVTHLVTVNKRKEGKKEKEKKEKIKSVNHNISYPVHTGSFLWMDGWKKGAIQKQNKNRMTRKKERKKEGNYHVNQSDTQTQTKP